MVGLIILGIIGFLVYSICIVKFAEYAFYANNSSNAEIAGGLFGAIVGLVLMACVVGEVQYDLKTTIHYDSTKHRQVQTDTTFISNNGNVDTLITYKLTNKDEKIDD